jgi:UDP-N-acetylglucosamine acyltransferase
MIHKTAVIDPSAKIAENVQISPYVVVGADVEIGSGTWIGSHVVISGPTKIGVDNRIYPFASLGEAPQDKKFAGEATELIIGDRNVIREYCTFNRGTVQDIGKTIVGSDNWIMAYVHIAHDCIIDNHTIMANGTTLAGHVKIEDYAILGGFSLIHQFCRIGAYAFTGMGTSIAKDVPPFVMSFGAPGIPRGINREGMKRHGFSVDAIKHMKEIYRLLYRSELTFQDALKTIESRYGQFAEVDRVLTFCHKTERGIIR